MPPKELPADVNPYVRHVYEHPGCLLPEPSPEALAAHRRASPSPGRRVVVDLGCGSGNFLLELAPAHPADHFIGFELRYKRLVKGARKLERGGLANVWLLRERAEALGDYFAPASLDVVHVNFPDPWPKFSHWKHRLVNAPLLTTLERLMKPGGQFRLQTDHSGYFLHVLALVKGRPGWRVAAFSNNARGPQAPGLAQQGPSAAGEARSEFEQMFRARHKPIYLLGLERLPEPGAGPA